jgi:hypothetical protein
MDNNMEYLPFYNLGAALPKAGFFEKFQTKLRRKYLAIL